jgi:hypothetical protein
MRSKFLDEVAAGEVATVIETSFGARVVGSASAGMRGHPEVMFGCGTID